MGTDWQQSSSRANCKSLPAVFIDSSSSLSIDHRFKSCWARHIMRNARRRQNRCDEFARAIGGRFASLFGSANRLGDKIGH